MKDAPYSAEATNEIIQTLANGNRIVRIELRVVSRWCRAHAARAVARRRGAVAASAGAAGCHQRSGRGVQLVLDPEKKTARRMRALPRLRPGPGVESKVEMEKVVAGSPTSFGWRAQKTRWCGWVGGVGEGRRGRADGAGRPRRRVGPATVFQAPEASSANTKTESLGTDRLKVFSAKGRDRHDDSGRRHRERVPIQMVGERWYSPELKMVVLTKRSDPRFGETISRLPNIVRAAPDASLFLGRRTTRSAMRARPQHREAPPQEQ